MALMPAGYGASCAEERASNQERAVEIFRQVTLPYLSFTVVTFRGLSPCGGDLPSGYLPLLVVILSLTIGTYFLWQGSPTR